MHPASKVPVVRVSGVTHIQFRHTITFKRGEKRVCFCVLMLALMIVPALSGQQQTAELTGQVTDPSGAVIPRATVTVTNDARGIKVDTKTGSTGEYVVPLLPPADGYQHCSTHQRTPLVDSPLAI